MVSSLVRFLIMKDCQRDFASLHGLRIKRNVVVVVVVVVVVSSMVYLGVGGAD